MPSAGPLLQALNDKWGAAGLKDNPFTGWFDSTGTEGAVPELQLRPYISVKVLGDAPSHFSNQSQYDLVSFEVSVFTDDKETGQLVLLPQIETATMFQSLSPPGNNLVLVRPGGARYEQIDGQYWKCAQEFTARLGRGINYHPL
jgi:hypothetical protein